MRVQLSKFVFQYLFLVGVSFTLLVSCVSRENTAYKISISRKYNLLSEEFIRIDTSYSYSKNDTIFTLNSKFQPSNMKVLTSKSLNGYDRLLEEYYFEEGKYKFFYSKYNKKSGDTLFTKQFSISQQDGSLEEENYFKTSEVRGDTLIKRVFFKGTQIEMSYYLIDYLDTTEIMYCRNLDTKVPSCDKIVTEKINKFNIVSYDYSVDMGGWILGDERSVFELDVVDDWSWKDSTYTKSDINNFYRYVNNESRGGVRLHKTILEDKDQKVTTKYYYR